MRRLFVVLFVVALIVIVVALLSPAREPQEPQDPQARASAQVQPRAPAPAPARPRSTASIDPVTGAEIGSGVPPGEISTWEQARVARPRGESQARAYLSEVQGELDSPLEQILPQMPDDLIPSRRQSGDRRIFAYAFEDGSRMILTFRPRGGGRGLTLYTVDVED